MEWFEKYGYIPIVIVISLLYIVLLYCVSFTIIKFVWASIGAFMTGWWISSVSFWLRDKIADLVKDGGIL